MHRLKLMQALSRLAIVSLLGGMLISVSACVKAEAALEKTAQRGQRIFLGKEPLVAKIGGHERPLPPQVAACVSCHAPARRASRGQQFAPMLNRAWLTESRVRRGGPAFAYDQQSFCTTVRSGMDPGYVILNRTMPRFEISHAQCGALWVYLSNEAQQ